MSIRDLTLKQIIIVKGLYKVLKKKRAKKLLNKFLEDANILNIYTEEMEKYNIVGASVALTIQGELEELKKKKPLFNSFNQYINIKQLNLRQYY